MKMFVKPEIGKKVTVIGKPFYPPNIAVGFHNLPSKISGLVIKSEPCDAPDSFRLATGLPHFPISVVTLTGILDLIFDDGAPAQTTEVRAVDDFTKTVKGSRGDEYIVTKKGDVYSCTCKGFAFNRKCKHINQVRQT